MIKPTIVLPIEVPLREWYPKAILAARLSSQGFRVIIGRDYLISNLVRPPIIYIGKNHVHYRKICGKEKKASKFIYFDDENAPIIGRIDNIKEITKTRLWTEIIQDADVITTWGRFQQEIFSPLTTKKIAAIGAPQIEVCKPPYQKVFSSSDDLVTHGLKGYYLINTRFSFLNGPYKLSEVDIDKPFWYSAGRKEKNFRLEVRDELNFFSDVLLLVERLSKEDPGNLVIIRPHPLENENTYKWLFKDIPNVRVYKNGHVIPWIRNSKAVITTGCTTSVQTVVAGKPLFNYKSKISNEIENYADTISEVFRDLDVMIPRVKHSEDIPSGIKASSEWSDPEEMFSLKKSTFDLLIEIINDLAEDTKFDSSPKLRSASAVIASIKEYLKNIIFNDRDIESSIVYSVIQDHCQAENLLISVECITQGCFVIERKIK